MSDELAGFGPGSWLPLSVQRSWRLIEADERRGAIEHQDRVQAAAERRRSADLQNFVRSCEERGEYYSPVDVAMGRVAGRGLREVLADAAARWQAEDDRAEAEGRRVRGEKLQFCGELEDPSARRRLLPDPEGELEDPSARSAGRARARAIERRNDAFFASAEANREAARKRAELERQVPSLRQPVRRNRRRAAPEDAQAVYERACYEMGVRPVSYR